MNLIQVLTCFFPRKSITRIGKSSEFLVSWRGITPSQAVVSDLWNFPLDFASQAWWLLWIPLQTGSAFDWLRLRSHICNCRWIETSCWCLMRAEQDVRHWKLSWLACSPIWGVKHTRVFVIDYGCDFACQSSPNLSSIGCKCFFLTICSHRMEMFTLRMCDRDLNLTNSTDTLSQLSLFVNTQ